jgi:hypothetical protein
MEIIRFIYWVFSRQYILFFFHYLWELWVEMVVIKFSYSVFNRQFILLHNCSIRAPWVMTTLTLPPYSDWLWAGRLRGWGSSPGRVKNYYFSMSSRPALGSTQPPIQWVPGALSRGESGRGVKLTTRLQLLPRSRKCGSIHPLPHTPSWRGA